jgi:hypothetical protein
MRDAGPPAPRNAVPPPHECTHSSALTPVRAGTDSFGCLPNLGIDSLQPVDPRRIFLLHRCARTGVNALARTVGDVLRLEGGILKRRDGRLPDGRRRGLWGVKPRRLFCNRSIGLPSSCAGRRLGTARVAGGRAGGLPCPALGRAGVGPTDRGGRAGDRARNGRGASAGSPRRSVDLAIRTQGGGRPCR